MHYYVVIPAAGQGSRFSSTCPKQYWMLGGKTILAWVIDFFLKFSFVDKIIVAICPDDPHWKQMALSDEERITIVKGGSARCQSVMNALEVLKATADDRDWVLVHDACRPLLEEDNFLKLIESLKNHSTGGILGIPVQDTLKCVDDHLTVLSSINRSSLWQAQTPQMFRYGVLYGALKGAIEKGMEVTDEAMALEQAGQKVKIVQGSPLNIKITVLEDLQLAEVVLGKV